jgi:hypothetical protein
VVEKEGKRQAEEGKEQQQQRMPQEAPQGAGHVPLPSQQQQQQQQQQRLLVGEVVQARPMLSDARFYEYVAGRTQVRRVADTCFSQHGVPLKIRC